MPNSLRIVSIGAGNIANHLIPSLYKLDCTITGVYSRSLDNAMYLANKVKSQPFTSLDDLPANSDIYIIMVADDALESVIQTMPELSSDAIVVHTSGASPITLFNRKFKSYGSFYPLQTFKKGRDIAISEVPFLLNASSPEVLRTIRTLARKLSPKVYEVTDKQRLYYHLSAVFINNFSNHMACIGRQVLSQNDLDPEVLVPIMTTTFDKILEDNPCSNQTGPAIRKDKNLQYKHLDLIKDNSYWSEVYKTISLSIEKTYHKNENS